MKVEAGGKRLEISDGGCRGLRLRASHDAACLDGTRRVWAVEIRIKNGPKRKITLGEYPDISLAEARNQANAIRVEARKAIDRVANEALRKANEIAEREAAEAAQAAKASTRLLLDEYARITLSGLKSGLERQRQLEAAFSAHMDTPLADVPTSALQGVVDNKAAEGKVVMGNRVRAAIRAFTAWAAQRGRIPTDIGFAVQKAGKERSRDVVLSVSEVRAIYDACGELIEPWRGIFRLLILTAQRRGVITGLRWGDVRADESALVIKGRDQKDGKTHITHMSDTAWACLPERKRANAFVFGSTAGASNISTHKAKLDKILGDTVQPWTLHDLRTAFATAMGERGTPEVVTDMVLNHSASSSKASTVSRVYNLASRLDERKEALEAWSEIVTGDDAEVLPLRKESAQ